MGGVDRLPEILSNGRIRVGLNTSKRSGCDESAFIDDVSGLKPNEESASVTSDQDSLM